MEGTSGRWPFIHRVYLLVSEGNVKANSTSFVRSIDTQVPYLLGACIDSASDVGGWVANQCGHPYLTLGKVAASRSFVINRVDVG